MVDGDQSHEGGNESYGCHERIDEEGLLQEDKWMDLECTGLDTVRLGRPDSLGLLLISNLQFAHGRVINSK